MFFNEQIQRVLESIPNGILFNVFRIVSTTPEEHLRDTEQAFGRLKRPKLIAKVKKCSFRWRKSSSLVTISPVLDWQFPKKSEHGGKYLYPDIGKAVIADTGFARLFSPLIFQFGGLAAPLCHLSGKDVEFQ